METFLKRFWKIFKGSSKDANSPSSIGFLETSTLARFVVESKKCSKGVLQATAFIPPKNLKLSTFFIDGLTEDGIWEIGEKEVAIPMNKTLYARGDLRVDNVPKLLKATLTNIPPRHVDIVGWPSEKDAQLELALELALKSESKMNPAPIKRSSKKTD